MGWRNPPVSWTEIERRLSDGRPPGPSGAVAYPGADGGDSPAWSRKRLPYHPVPLVRSTEHTPYAELHCHSNFSFLDGASHPEELVEEAVRLGLDALALTDHDGFYGIVRFAEAARAHGLPTVFGTELTLGATSPRAGADGVPDPTGAHLLVLARSPEGYARLARAVSAAQMAGRKAQPRLSLDELTELAGVGTAGEGHWMVLTGCRKGLVPAALLDAGPRAAAARLDELTARFGAEQVAVELWDHGDPLDSAR